MKRVTDEDFIGRRVVKLLQNDISYYAMHTNYDVLGMAKLAEDILGIEKTYVLDVTMEKDGAEEGIGRIGMLEREMTLEECCLYVKHKLKLGSVKVYGDMKKCTLSCCFSRGGKVGDNAGDKKGADVLVTGDIGHHDGIDAVEQGLAVIDAGHYGTEYIFIDDMKCFLHEKLPVLDVMSIPIVHPFQVL